MLTYPPKHLAGKKKKGEFHPSRLIKKDSVWNLQSIENPRVQSLDRLAAHGIVPILAGTLIIWAGGPLETTIRGIGLVICLLWAWVSLANFFLAKRWRLFKKAIWFCAVAGVLACGCIWAMYSFLSQKLNDLQELTWDGIKIQAFSPPNSDLWFSEFEVKNEGPADIGDHQIVCEFNSFRAERGFGENNLFRIATWPRGTPLKRGSDAQTYACLEPMGREGWLGRLECADVTVLVNYELVNQEGIKKQKRLRFVADQQHGYVWHQQLVQLPGRLCDIPAVSQ